MEWTHLCNIRMQSCPMASFGMRQLDVSDMSLSAAFMIFKAVLIDQAS